MKRHVLIVLNSITLPTCENPHTNPVYEPDDDWFDFEIGDLIYYYPIGFGKKKNIHFVDSTTMVALGGCSVQFMNANTTRNDGKMFFFVENEEDVPKHRGEILGLKLDIV